MVALAKDPKGEYMLDKMDSWPLNHSQFWMLIKQIAGLLEIS